MSELEPEEDDAARLEAASKVVAARYGGAPRLTVTDILRQQYRNRVLRCAVQGAGHGAPESVIIKAVVGQGESAYDPDNDARGETAQRFYNEWAGNAFLDTISVAPPLGAGLIGGDRTAGLIVLHDLGKEGVSLADRMMANDRPALMAALQSFAASLGRLHALTHGKEAEFARIRREIGGAEPASPETAAWDISGFREVCASVGETIPDGLDEEILRIGRTLAEPGSFFAFSPGDTCPDNHRLTETPYVRFFDFEFAGFNPTMPTLAYFYLPFPTCWCVNRLPPEAVAQMEEAYRTEFAAVCPEVADDSVFYPALLASHAHWTVMTVSWSNNVILGDDEKWGISTVRQRHLLRLENFADASERSGHYPVLGDLSRRLAANLRDRWQLAEEMPLYPAFRQD